VTQCHRRQTADDFWLAEVAAIALQAGWLLRMCARRWNGSRMGDLLGRPHVAAGSVSKPG